MVKEYTDLCGKLYYSSADGSVIFVYREGKNLVRVLMHPENEPTCGSVTKTPSIMARYIHTWYVEVCSAGAITRAYHRLSGKRK